MHGHSSSTSSLARPPDFSKTVPFVSRDVFRLVVRLEAQKALDVNVAALEQRFRVPPGYADDNSLNARGEAKQPKNLVPGPGTYEVPEQWPVRNITASPTAAFISRTTRGPCSPARQEIVGAHDKVDQPHDSNAECASPIKKTKSPRTRLRLPSSSVYRGLQILVPELQLSEANDIPETAIYSSLNPRNTSTFSKVGREPEFGKENAPAVGSYDIKRLWDSTAPRTTMGAPSPALFGASKGKREVTWRPSLTPASNAVSTSWDSSRHYAKQKDKVVRNATKRRLHSAKLHSRTISSPTLRPATANPTIHHNSHFTAEVVSTEQPQEDDDPFSWLRQRPNGEHRVNLLAAKHGLVNHIKSTTRRSSIEYRRPTLSHWDDQVTPGTPSSRLVRQHSDVGEIPSTEPVYAAKPKDVRITVCCRMPGGMLISTSVYSMKKLGHFKAAILARQKRFQTMDQFDLYHASGRKLTGLENTLMTCGVLDRSLLQIVPTVTLALAPQGNTSVNDTTR